MTEQELKKILSEKYSENTVDFLVENGMSDCFSNADDWNQYCDALKALVAQNLPEKEFTNRAFIMPRQYGIIIYDE